jgi:hypothetical protein
MDTYHWSGAAGHRERHSSGDLAESGADEKRNDGEKAMTAKNDGRSSGQSLGQEDGAAVLDHAALVDAWLKRSAKALSPEDLLRLFEAALGALWARTKLTLGEVTLTAIADRVLHNTSETFPIFASLKVEPTGGIPFRQLRERITSVHGPELVAGIRFVLVEFLTVLGNLTAEILTSELHSELSNVVLPKNIEGEDKGQ